VVTTDFNEGYGSNGPSAILIYTTNTEVAGIGGNYYGGDSANDVFAPHGWLIPSTAPACAALDTADLTRDYFPTDIRWMRITQNGWYSCWPKLHLFGLGSPAGIINNTLKDPNMSKFGLEAQFRVGTYGSTRRMLV